jgi:hypothetical protein
VSTLRADAMAIGADDIALRSLCEERCRRPKHRPAFGQAEALGLARPVIEIHLVRREDAPAVGAGPRPELPKELDGASLADAHS